MDLSARRLRAFEVASAKACAATGPTDRQPTILPAARKRELETAKRMLQERARNERSGSRSDLKTKSQLSLLVSRSQNDSAARGDFREGVAALA
jgi:hypothetical protein